MKIKLNFVCQRSYVYCVSSLLSSLFKFFVWLGSVWGETDEWNSSIFPGNAGITETMAFVYQLYCEGPH